MKSKIQLKADSRVDYTSDTNDNDFKWMLVLLLRLCRSTLWGECVDILFRACVCCTQGAPTSFIAGFYDAHVSSLYYWLNVHISRCYVSLSIIYIYKNLIYNLFLYIFGCFALSCRCLMALGNDIYLSECKKTTRNREEITRIWYLHQLIQLKPTQETVWWRVGMSPGLSVISVRLDLSVFQQAEDES